MMRVVISRAMAVHCRATLDLPLSAGAAWGQLRDFTRFAARDPFHAQVRIEGGAPRLGARLAIIHRHLGFSAERTGRILRWREFDRAADWRSGAAAPAGYTFSDLSTRGPRRGFPHVFEYVLRPTGARRCTLEVIVRGRWTARRIPRPLAWLWLWRVFSQTVSSITNALLLAALAQPAQVNAEKGDSSAPAGAGAAEGA